MDDQEWILQREAEVGRFEVRFPGNTAPDELPPYIELSARAESGKKVKEYLRTSTRRGASGNQLWISDGALKGVLNGQTALWSEASPLRYHVYRVFHDPRQRLMLFGLFIALLGVAIDASLDIGKVSPIWRVSQLLIALSKWVSYLLKLGGLLLAFCQGVLQGEV